MKRILSVFSVLGGAGIIAYSIYLMVIRIFSGKFITRNLVFLVIGVLLLAIGILGNIKISKKRSQLSDEQRAKTQKGYRTAMIVTGAVAVSVVFFIALPLISQKATADHVEKMLRPLMKDDYTQIGVSIPDDPRYILYNVNKQVFETEANSILKSFNGNPDKVNVVVAYKSGVNEIGSWETEGGIFVSKGYEETIKIEVIRLSDWSLIEERTFSPLHSVGNLGTGDEQYTYQISLYDSEIVDYLNNRFDGK